MICFLNKGYSSTQPRKHSPIAMEQNLFLTTNLFKSKWSGRLTTIFLLDTLGCILGRYILIVILTIVLEESRLVLAAFLNWNGRGDGIGRSRVWGGARFFSNLLEMLSVVFGIGSVAEWQGFDSGDDDRERMIMV